MLTPTMARKIKHAALADISNRLESTATMLINGQIVGEQVRIECIRLQDRLREADYEIEDLRRQVRISSI